jgi:hypothetical protein
LIKADDAEGEGQPEAKHSKAIRTKKTKKEKEEIAAAKAEKLK